jgi:GNAT superfamily N-acetyltransferase
MASPPAVIRPARPADRAAVMAISAQIWDGDDYIPAVWDSWLADPHGGFLVATLRGRVVALGKLTCHAAGQWWLEGMRVDPRYRGRGLARRMHEYQVALADRLDLGIIRFATGGDNAPMHHLGEQTGFRRVGRYARLTAPAAAPGEGVPALEPFRRADLAELDAFLRRSPRLRADAGLYSAGWVFYPLTAERLARFVRARTALGWRDEAGRIRAVVLVSNSREGRRLHVDFADVRPRRLHSLAALGLALRALARRRRRTDVYAELPAGSPWERAWRRAGFDYEWGAGEELWIFERPSPHSPS